MFEVEPIPAFEDNYIWLLSDRGEAVVVDPGEAEPVLDLLGARNLRLSAILCTHHHGDHVGGNRDLLAAYPATPVYGPRRETIPGLTEPLASGDRVDLLGLSFAVIDVPGHTAGHIAYYGAGRLFCGDTLFACGCGRLFEGTAEQMYDSLQKLSALPDDTLVYCAHEYTLSNIRFARAVEPDNADLQLREATDTATRQRGHATLPSRLDLEKRTNPFLRCDRQPVIEAVQRHSGRRLEEPAAVFAAVRAWKDAFR